MFRYFSAFFSLLFLLGCAGKPATPSASKTESLAKAFERLDASVRKDEAMRLSRDLYQKTALMKEEFQMVSPPQMHNFLVNTGVREKGLCYHWSDALFAYVKRQGYEGFDFHLVGANIGEYWSEHNALLVVAKGCESEACLKHNGIIIDAWRDAGELYYVKIDEDTAYKWKHRSGRCEPAL